MEASAIMQCCDVQKCTTDANQHVTLAVKHVIVYKRDQALRYCMQRIRMQRISLRIEDQ